MEHGGQSEKLGVSGHVNIQSRIFSVPCLIHQVRIGLPRCQVKFSFTIVGSYHHHPIYMTSPGVFDEQGLCWNPCFLFAGATLRLGGVIFCSKPSDCFPQPSWRTSFRRMRRSMLLPTSACFTRKWWSWQVCRSHTFWRQSALLACKWCWQQQWNFNEIHQQWNFNERTKPKSI